MASSTPCSGVHPDQRQLVARRRASRFDAMILTLSKGLASVAFSALLVQASVAQDAPVLSDPVVDDAGEKGQGVKEVDTSTLTEGIAEAHKKFEEYTKQQKTLLESYQDLQATLKHSEQELQRIQSDGIRREFQAMQSAIKDMQIAGAIGNLSLPTTGQETQATAQMRMQMQQQLMANRTMQNLDAMMNSRELQSLTIEAQKTIRKRYEAIQAAMQLEEKYRQWQLGATKFLPIYWEFSDPEGIASQTERSAMLDALRQGDKKNEACLLAQVLLLYREKDYTQAANAIESIAENPGALQPIALMTQALIQAKREKEKDAKQAMQASIKLDRSNPYCRWLRAQLALAQKQTTIAETEWKALAANPNFSSAANRRLALNFSQRSKKTPGDANRAVLAATKSLQSDDTKATWFAHYVLAIALYTAGKSDEAIESLDKAVELAKEDQLERCASLRKAIDAAETPDFDF